MKRWKSCILYSIFKVFLLHLHFILGLKKSCVLIFWPKNEYFLKIQNAIVFIQKGPFGVRIRSIHFMLLDKRHLFAVGCLSVTSNVSLTLLYKFYMTLKGCVMYNVFFAFCHVAFSIFTQYCACFCFCGHAINGNSWQSICLIFTFGVVIPKWINEEWSFWLEIPIRN